jgi:beta-1,4-mannosyltransferase
VNEIEVGNVYCYPNAMDDNDYLKINIRLWQELGLNIRSFNSILKKTFTPYLWGKDYLILNFFENSVLGRSPFFRLVRAVSFLLFARCVVKKIIWVRHNYGPHNTCGVDIRWYKYICFFLDNISHEIVAHKEVSTINVTHVIPHPLYFPTDNVPLMTISKRSLAREFLYFGQVRKYKGLSSLLIRWPTNVQLVMLGSCNDIVLEEEIRSIINQRNLNVVWRNEFISKELLDDAILKADCVIIPHVDKSMIVTGSAFHAMSLGANLLINESEFSDWATKLYPFASSYNSSTLNEHVNNTEFVKKHDVLISAIKNNGDEIVKQAWKSVFI